MTQCERSLILEEIKPKEPFVIFQMGSAKVVVFFKNNYLVFVNMIFYLYFFALFPRITKSIKMWLNRWNFPMIGSVQVKRDCANDRAIRVTIMPDYPRYVTPRSWKGLLTPLTLAERPRKTANWHGLSTHRFALHSWVASLLMYSRLWVASFANNWACKKPEMSPCVWRINTLHQWGNHLYWPNNHKLLANKINLMWRHWPRMSQKGKAGDFWKQMRSMWRAEKATELTFILSIGVFFCESQMKTDEK